MCWSSAFKETTKTLVFSRCQGVFRNAPLGSMWDSPRRKGEWNCLQGYSEAALPTSTTKPAMVPYCVCATLTEDRSNSVTPKPSALSPVQIRPE